MENEQRPKSAFPLAMLLALASALGVAVAVALAGVAMLLAAPAYADQGSLLLERSGGLAEATLLFAGSESQEEGRTRVVEAYHNPFAEQASGVYLHRLPENALVERLAFSPRVEEARHAVFTVRMGSALVERTGKIGPGEILVVELEYRGRGVPRMMNLR
jgi:hypothetical protein